MRRAVVTGNWKMNTNKEEALSLTNSIIANTEDIINVDIVIAPPFFRYYFSCKNFESNKNKIMRSKLLA